MDVDKVRWALRMINIKEMAKETGLHAATLYRFRDGDNSTSLKTAIKVSEFLKKLSEGCDI